MEVSKDLAAAIGLLIRYASQAEESPGDRDAARRAVEQASVVASLARAEGFGEPSEGDHDPPP